MTRLSSVLSTARSLRRLPIVILCLALLGVTVYPIPRGGCDHVSNAHGGCTVYPIFAMLLSRVYRVPFPSRFLSILRLCRPSYRFQPFRCRVCRPFRAFVFRCYRCYRYSLYGLPSSVSVIYRRCHAASKAILILLVSAVLRHVDSISLVVVYLSYDVLLLYYFSASPDIHFHFAPASVSVIYCYLFYRYHYYCYLGLWNWDLCC